MTNKSSKIIELSERVSLQDNTPLTPCWPSYGYGIAVRVYPNDKEPIRAHIYDDHYNEFGEVLYTKTVPNKISDIIVNKGYIADNYKNIIVEWANDIDQYKNWHEIRNAWEASHD